jgi:hypothetical protein
MREKEYQRERARGRERPTHARVRATYDAQRTPRRMETEHAWPHQRGCRLASERLGPRQACDYTDRKQVCKQLPRESEREWKEMVSVAGEWFGFGFGKRVCVP